MSTEAIHQADPQAHPKSVSRMRSSQCIASLWRTVIPYLSLLKLRIVLLLQVVAGTSAIIAGGGLPPANRIGLLLLSGALASAGASVLNHYLDRDVDALMERTRRRPLPAGRIKHPGRAAILGVGLVLASLPVSLSLSWLVAVYILLGATFYVLVYTWWLKRRSQLSVVIGGAAGSFAALAGWAAVEPRLSAVAFFIALLVFLWTPLHFWNFALANVRDYRRARVPMLPVMVGVRWARYYIAATALAVFACSLLPWAMGYLGRYYLGGAVVLSTLLWGNLALVRNVKLAWLNYKLSGPYLLGVLVAMAVDSAQRPLV